MIVIMVMTVNVFPAVVAIDRNTLILTCKSLEERCNALDFVLRELNSCLIISHVADSFFQCFPCTIVIVWPCMLHIAKSRQLFF